MEKKIVSRLLSIVFWGGVFFLAFSILGFSLWQASAESRPEASLSGTLSASLEATGTRGNRSPEELLATAESEATESIKDVSMSPTSLVVAYALPHPGLLPGHPLYWLKMVRDQIRLFLTNQPARRAGLLLHYADKRLAAAGGLTTEGKLGLATETAAKAEIYLLRCRKLIVENQNSEELVTVKGEFNLSLGKHRSVLAQLVQELGPNRSLLEVALQTFNQIKSV